MSAASRSGIRASRSRPSSCFLDRDVPPELEAWFEHAINCCAFLACAVLPKRVIHFRSNGYEFANRRTETYTILKYRAGVPAAHRGSRRAV